MFLLQISGFFSCAQADTFVSSQPSYLLEFPCIKEKKKNNTICPLPNLDKEVCVLLPSSRGGNV